MAMIAAWQMARLRPILMALLSLGAAVFVVDQSLIIFLGRDPAWLPPVFYDFQQKIGSRLAEVQWLSDHGQLDEKQLVVVLGVSPVQAGLDSRLLSASDPHHRQWLLLGTQGSTFLDLEIAARMFVDSSVRPGLIVVGFNGVMLHKKDHILHTNRVMQALSDRLWLYRNLWSFHDWAAIEKYRAADEFRRLFSLPMYATYAADPDPWAPQEVYSTPRAPEYLLKNQREVSRRNLRVDQYQQNQDELESFQRVISELDNRSSRVEYVVMPEASILRNLYPSIARDQLNGVLAVQSAKGRPPQVVNLRESMSDDMFYDYCHLNDEGRRSLCRLLPAELQ